MTARSGDGSFSIGSDVWPGVSKLIEEMGELHQVLGKLIALHGETDHWDGTDLRVRLVEEIGDVTGAVNFMTAVNLNIRERIDIGQRAEDKRRLFEKWHYDQRSDGLASAADPVSRHTRQADTASGAER